MSENTMNGAWLERITLKDVQKARTYLQTARTLATNPWTKTAVSPTHLFVALLYDFVETHVEVTERAVALVAQKEANHLRQRRHQSAREHAQKILVDKVSHRLLVLSKLEALQAVARDQRDIESYKLLGEHIRALHFRDDKEFDAEFEAAYKAFGTQKIDVSHQLR